MFARRSDPEPRTGDEDPGTDVALLIQNEVRVVAPLAEEASAKARPLHTLQPVRGDDLIGVDVRSLQRDGAALDDANRFHASNSSGEAKRPMTAVAAATAGETRWVRPPRPWRPSKLRFEVEAHRCSGFS